MVCRECFSNSMSESTQRKTEYDTTFKDIYFHNSKTIQGFIFKSFHTLGGRHYEHNMSFPAKCKTVAFVNFVMSTISGTISQKLIMNRFREHIKCWLWGLIWRKVQKWFCFQKWPIYPFWSKKKAVPLFCVYWALTSYKKSESYEPIHIERRCLRTDGVEFNRPSGWARGPKIPSKYKKLGKYFWYSTLYHGIQ